MPYSRIMTKNKRDRCIEERLIPKTKPWGGRQRVQDQRGKEMDLEVENAEQADDGFEIGKDHIGSNGTLQGN